MRRVALLVAAVVLGAGCTGDRPAPRVEATFSDSEGAKLRCRMSPGPPPEGFVMSRSRDFRYDDHIGVREEYEHPDGRLLVYLLGVTGEMGEGATIVENMELASGKKATLFGTRGTDAWSLVWSDRLPCPQMAVVGNGFGRAEFLSALRSTGVLAGDT